jgi:hypothetical protein
MVHGAAWRREWLHRWVWVLSDAAIWFAAIYGATSLRFDFKWPPVLVASTPVFATSAVLVHLFVGALIGPYAVGHRHGSFEKTTDIGRTVVVATGGLLVWALIANPLIANPLVVARSVPVVAGALALVSMFAVRLLIRSRRSRHFAAQENEKRVVAFRRRRCRPSTAPQHDARHRQRLLPGRAAGRRPGQAEAQHQTGRLGQCMGPGPDRAWSAWPDDVRLHITPGLTAPRVAAIAPRVTPSRLAHLRG